MYNTVFIYFEINFTSFLLATAFTTSIVTVPDLGFGIKPLGPKILPNGPNFPITAGIVTITSTSQPSLIFFVNIHQDLHNQQPASLASASLSELLNANTLTSLPVPLRKDTTPLTIWFVFLGLHLI